MNAYSKNFKREIWKSVISQALNVNSLLTIKYDLTEKKHYYITLQYVNAYRENI